MKTVDVAMIRSRLLKARNKEKIDLNKISLSDRSRDFQEMREVRKLRDFRDIGIRQKDERFVAPEARPITSIAPNQTRLQIEEKRVSHSFAVNATELRQVGKDHASRSSQQTFRERGSIYEFWLNGALLKSIPEA